MSRSVSELVNLKLVEPADVVLGPRGQKCRRLYESREYALWSSTLCSDRRPNQLLSERGEIDAVYEAFVTGKPLANVLLGVTKPAGRGIFKLKTTSFRLFGWAPEAQTLILCVGARKSEFADRTLIERHIPPVVLALRQAMGVFEEARGEWHELFSATR